MQLTNGDQLNEKLTIRTNGTNRQASFTMVIFYQWFVCTNGTIGTNRQIVFAWLSGVNEMQLTNGDQLNEKLTNVYLFFLSATVHSLLLYSLCLNKMWLTDSIPID